MKKFALHPAVRQESMLVVSLASCLMFFLEGEALFRDLSNPLWLGFLFLWLFAVIIGSASSVVRHAERLAHRLGEPYGTLILTLSVVSIEIMSITAVMMGEHTPTLVRDTLFSVVMIIMNGMVGLSLLIGAWKHREQQYNFQGANAYLGAIIPLTVLSLLLPNYTVATTGPTFTRGQEIFVIFTCLCLYATFIAIQTSRHRGYFMFGDETAAHGQEELVPRPRGAPHALLLLLYMAPVVILAEQLAHPINYVIEVAHAPVSFGGVVMALLVVTPEGIGAVRAAASNHLQRSVNISLGSVLSTIGLTVPAMLIVSGLIHQTLTLGLQETDAVMLVLTLATSIVTFASGRTNVLQGVVHLILFAAYLLLIFDECAACS